MKLTRVHPGPAESIDLDVEASRATLLEWYRPPRPEWLRTNLVLNVAGSATGSDGTSESLTTGADRRVLGVIRELSDVVLVGASSVRTEGYRVPTRSRLAILTGTGELAGHQLAPEKLERVTVIGPAAALERAAAALPGAELLEVASPDDGVGGEDARVDVRSAVGSLRAAGYSSIVCEGGPSLAAQLATAGLVDEWCLTTAPLLGPVRSAALAGAVPDGPLELAQVLIDETSTLFARWLTPRV